MIKAKARSYEWDITYRAAKIINFWIRWYKMRQKKGQSTIFYVLLPYFGVLRGTQRVELRREKRSLHLPRVETECRTCEDEDEIIDAIGRGKDLGANGLHRVAMDRDGSDELALRIVEADIDLTLALNSERKARDGTTEVRTSNKDDTDGIGGGKHIASLGRGQETDALGARCGLGLLLGHRIERSNLLDTITRVMRHGDGGTLLIDIDALDYDIAIATTDAIMTLEIHGVPEDVPLALILVQVGMIVAILEAILAWVAHIMMLIAPTVGLERIALGQHIGHRANRG